MNVQPPLRVLLTALGGEGGGMLMNWLVEAARQAGHGVQATSVPGVAQRTGSTSYYVEIARDEAQAVLGLVPMPGRVDVVVSSELVETARVLAAGFVSPKLTTLISSTARVFSTAEKIVMGDGRYSQDNVQAAARKLAKQSHMLDLGQLATDNGTFVSATMFGALAGSGVLPWSVAQSRAVLGDLRSEAGFDAAVAALNVDKTALTGNISEETPEETSAPFIPATGEFSGLPDTVQSVISHGLARVTEYQDVAYGESYLDRVRALIAATDLADHRAVHALTEACRRLALWMAYEDIARVAELKTRPERFERIRQDSQATPGQVLTITEYMKPRVEEIADILPVSVGRYLMARLDRGRSLPFLGRGIYLRSNGIIGYRMLRLAASFRALRRRSYRFEQEQAAIEDWLDATCTALRRSPEFAMGLAELPRVLKGYSDTLMRGKAAYGRIMDDLVRPALLSGDEAPQSRHLRDAIGAALADDSHEKLDAVLTGTPLATPIPQLRKSTHA